MKSDCLVLRTFSVGGLPHSRLQPRIVTAKRTTNWKDYFMAIAIESFTVLLTLAGLAYLLLALWGARDFHHFWRRGGDGAAPDVSILKPVKGLDQSMYAGLVSH